SDEPERDSYPQKPKIWSSKTERREPFPPKTKIPKSSRARRSHKAPPIQTPFQISSIPLRLSHLHRKFSISIPPVDAPMVRELRADSF
uniref:Uncharacterized protein n=1 Tax=Aegilops tauschii subsp. strangulata TaxID=200361 RepID=A0A453KCV7_AEGTS